MKKIVALFCVISMLFCLCSCFRLSPEVETTTEETTENLLGENETENVDYPQNDLPTVEQSEWQTGDETQSEGEIKVENTEPSETGSHAETTTEPRRVTALPNPEGSTVVDVTPNGFEVALKDGITYIGGIMIANKSYELPSTYNPDGLTEECNTAFYKMVDAAAADGINLYVLSGFRSYETQSGLYTRYCNSDGQDAADTYSARPGHSEHQTGLAIDVNSVSHTFADTAEGVWLAKHCAEYGFILRYPEGKNQITGYIYEPWHIRYIGSVELAQQITASGLCLEEYLGIDSVYAQG